MFIINNSKFKKNLHCDSVNNMSTAVDDDVIGGEISFDEISRDDGVLEFGAS